MSWANKSPPWWFTLSQYMQWQVCWVGRHHQQSVSGICAKKSFYECYKEIMGREVTRFSLIPDNKALRLWHGIRYHQTLGDHFFRHLPALLGTNPCIVTAIKQIHASQTQCEFRGVCLMLIQDITAGQTFSQALSAHPDYFTTLDIRCIRLGEASGHLIPVFKAILQHRHLQQHIQTTIRNSCRYPLFLLLFALVTLIFFLLQIIPQFATILSNIGMAVPTHTQQLIQVATWLTHHLYLITTGLLCGAIYYYMLPYSAPVSIHTYQLLWRPPTLKRLEWQFRFCHTLAILVENRMALAQGIRCMISLCSDQQEKHQLTMLCAAIHNGMGFSAACGHSKILPAPLIQQLMIAEQSHTVAATLQSIAEQLEQQSTQLLHRYADLLAPSIILGVGIFIGSMLYCLYLPMLEAPLSL